MLLAVIITAVVGTYMYRHRFDKYEQSQEEQAAGIKAIGKDSRFLVTYFSWPSPDYPDLDATSGASNIVKDGKLYGNTEYIADILSKKLNADLFRIETVRSYPTEPKALLDIARTISVAENHHLLCSSSHTARTSRSLKKRIDFLLMICYFL